MSKLQHKKPKFHPGLYYNRTFITPYQRREILQWLQTIYPIWENRYSQHNPPPEGEEQRQLLRPVYWLGNWQFACLNYYHPPQGIFHRCVSAEPFPQVLAQLVQKIEAQARRIFFAADMPQGWHLNTCLLNFYGDHIRDDGKIVDTARVGEHRDFEPGPVASLSLGERAMFQFVRGGGVGVGVGEGQKTQVVLEQWLDDGSLQIFGGTKWKSQLFHRVQRVDRKDGHHFPMHMQNFRTRRLNFTFRYVPVEHIVPFGELPFTAREDVSGYMQTLAQHSPFFQQQLTR